MKNLLIIVMAVLLGCTALTDDPELKSASLTPKNVSSVSIDAICYYLNDDAYVRVTMGDLLVYEGYKFLEEDTVRGACEETYNINVPFTDLEVETKDAFIRVLHTYKNERIDVKKQEKKRKDRMAKLQKHVRWFVGETSVSKMKYKDRMKLWNGQHFPNGFEYYSGGIIDLRSNTKSATINTIPDIDWRNVEGHNWLTSVKNQGACGSCWAFAVCGTLEHTIIRQYVLKALETNPTLNVDSLIALYSFDLSEQQLIDCTQGSCSGGLPGTALGYIRDYGIPLEESNIYHETDETSCIHYPVKATIDGFTPYGYQYGEDTLRSWLQTGVVSGGLLDWQHAMPLVGVHTVAVGDTFYFARQHPPVHEWRTIAEGDTLIGSTLWIFKNSWGEWFGDRGYCYIETDLSNIYWTYKMGNAILLDGEMPIPDPEYCLPRGSLEAWIRKVQIGNFTMTSSPSRYTYFQNGPTVTAGTSYKVNVECNKKNVKAYIWIDYNKNKEFEPHELLKSKGKVTMPVQTGNTRMRVSTDPDPCGNYGSIWDFPITIR